MTDKGHQIISAKRQEEIISKIREQRATSNCPRCGNNSFSLVDGYFNLAIQGQPAGNVQIGGPSVPTIALVCDSCGYISLHALGALGLLDQTEG